MVASDHSSPQQFGDFDPYDSYPSDDYPEEPEIDWNPRCMFHGTVADLKPGDTVEPAHPGNFADTHDKRHRNAYATTRLGNARDYAERVAYDRGKPPRVYEVAPADDMTLDPEEGAGLGIQQVSRSTSWKSGTGFRVVQPVTSKASRRALDTSEWGYQSQYEHARSQRPSAEARSRRHP